MCNKVRVISENRTAVVVVLDSTEIVREMEAIHKTSAVVSAALGRLLTGASIMASWLKHPDDSLTLRVNGGGPIKGLVAAADGAGNVRGYANVPVVEIPLRADGKLDVGAAVGKDGTLAVVKDLGLREPYIGQTPLVSGEIAEDITAYYAASEQTASVCALGVLVDKDLSILRAGGFLLQLLPGANDADVKQLEGNVQGLPSITQMLGDGLSPVQVGLRVLHRLNPHVLERTHVAYKCHCSREKTKDILFSLGTQELEGMRREDPAAQVECHFCGKKYRFDIDALLEGKS